MNRKVQIVLAIVIAVAGLAFAQVAFAQGPAPSNQVAVDITLSDNGQLTIGGIDLGKLGIAPLAKPVTDVAKNVNSVHLVLRGELVQVDVGGTPLMKMQWAQSSREALTNLAASYGYAISPAVMSRIEEWVASSNLDLMARFTNQPSKPLVLNIAKPVIVDLGSNGSVAIEKGPLAYGIQQDVMNAIQRGGIKNAVVCWNKGTLALQVDNKALPSITLDPAGVRLVTKILNQPELGLNLQSLGIDNGVDPVFSSNLGVDVSVAGGAHSSVTCK